MSREHTPTQTTVERPTQKQSDPAVCYYHQTYGSQGTTVPTTMQLKSSGKFKSRSLIATLAIGPRGTLFCVLDRNSGRRFLVETGAEVSVIPATNLDSLSNSSTPSLVSANGSSIRTYGTHKVQNNLGIQPYVSTFLVVIGSQPNWAQISCVTTRYWSTLSARNSSTQLLSYQFPFSLPNPSLHAWYALLHLPIHTCSC